MRRNLRVWEWSGHRKAATLTAGAAIAVGLVAGGCGDGGGGGGGKKGGDVTVGLLVPLTGELGDFGKGWQQAAELARDQLNSTGGLPGGSKIKTVVADEKASAQTAISEARKMISTQNAAAIVGPTSEPMVALVPIAKRARVPVISGAAGSVQLNKLAGDYIYRTVSSDDSDGLAQAKWVGSQKAGAVGMLVENAASPSSVAATFRAAFEKQGGKIATSVVYNSKQASYRTEVGKVLRANPTWIVCACGQLSGASIIKEVLSSGYKGQWMLASDLATDGVLKAVGPDRMAGMYSQSPSTDQSGAAYKAYAAAFKQRYGKGPGLLEANAFDAMALVGLAMVKSGSTSGKDIEGALREVAGPPGQQVTSIAEGVTALKAGKDIDYQGASGPVDFDDSGTVPSSYAIMQVKKGKWTQVEFYPASDFAGAGAG